MNSSTENITDDTVWVALADLFFLDTESTDDDYAYAANLIRKKGWKPDYVQWLLVRAIAPNAGGNLGFLLYPVIGEWAGFDKAKLSVSVSRSIALSQGRPDWYFTISDWWCRCMLNKLGMKRLLDLLKDPFK